MERKDTGNVQGGWAGLKAHVGLAVTNFEIIHLVPFYFILFFLPGYYFEGRRVKALRKNARA